MNEYQEHDKHILGKIYDFMCKDEGLSRLPLKFGRVGKGGAKCTYRGIKPLSITIDLGRISVGSVYALCHEVAHQIEIPKGNATHNRSFKKTEQYLVKKYSRTILANSLYW